MIELYIGLSLLFIVTVLLIAIMVICYKEPERSIWEGEPADDVIKRVRKEIK